MHTRYGIAPRMRPQLRPAADHTPVCTFQHMRENDSPHQPCACQRPVMFPPDKDHTQTQTIPSLMRPSRMRAKDSPRNAQTPTHSRTDQSSKHCIQCLRRHRRSGPPHTVHTQAGPSAPDVALSRTTCRPTTPTTKQPLSCGTFQHRTQRTMSGLPAPGTRLHRTTSTLPIQKTRLNVPCHGICPKHT